jgi:hypothetical protein
MTAMISEETIVSGDSRRSQQAMLQERGALIVSSGADDGPEGAMPQRENP